MKTNLSIAGITIGLIVVIAFVGRFIFKDLPEISTMLGIGIGVLIVAVSWLQGENSKRARDIEAIENWISDHHFEVRDK